MATNRVWCLSDLIGSPDYRIAETLLERYLTGALSAEEWARFDADIAARYGFLSERQRDAG